MGTGKLLGQNLTNCGGMTCDGLASRPGGSRNTPSRFILQKLGISSGSYDPVGSKASFFLLCPTYILNQ